MNDEITAGFVPPRPTVRDTICNTGTCPQCTRDLKKKQDAWDAEYGIAQKDARIAQLEAALSRSENERYRLLGIRDRAEENKQLTKKVQDLEISLQKLQNATAGRYSVASEFSYFTGYTKDQNGYSIQVRGRDSSRDLVLVPAEPLREALVKAAESYIVQKELDNNRRTIETLRAAEVRLQTQLNNALADAAKAKPASDPFVNFTRSAHGCGVRCGMINGKRYYVAESLLDVLDKYMNMVRAEVDADPMFGGRTRQQRLDAQAATIAGLESDVRRLNSQNRDQANTIDRFRTALKKLHDMGRDRLYAPYATDSRGRIDVQKEADNGIDLSRDVWSIAMEALNQ